MWAALIDLKSLKNKRRQDVYTQALYSLAGRCAIDGDHFAILVSPDGMQLSIDMRDADDVLCWLADLRSMNEIW